ncbi:ribonucleotide reductase inhibitor-domain-containing protein [Coniella lustricola]|uniref:Ribonucleotide reductase inhibitor-domain-containing protein n=1 Tax=Coniella lustricola TaxID=2025994 RepID=A0A2T3A6W8_9PEZI|nr:ribonucleotide reductase inhibitor-domain-containing protein [Coniella lustricola]
MSAPRTKRQFAGAASDPSQRQITSFFNHATSTSTSTSTSSASASSDSNNTSSRPVLPASTQANLLNVGMRVRKSVPEGYKTGSYSAFSLFVDAKERQPAGTAAVLPAACASSYTNTQRELLPFCGINKVGGLSAQPGSDSLNIESDGSLPPIDDVPSLSASQDSITSHASVPSIITTTTSTPGNRKRSFDDKDGEDDMPSISSCLQIPSGQWMDGQVSPRSLVPIGWENTRVMAMPKKLRRNKKTTLDQLGQENMVLDGDFPDADFLDYKLLAGDAMEI